VLDGDTAAAIKRAHEGFERERSRVWLQRIRAGLEYRRAMRQIDEGVAGERQERDRLIRDAVAAGASYREVAWALGLSHSRIQQIVNAGAAGSGGETSR
jgi:hypothetical protein